MGPSSLSFPASSLEQFCVSASRARHAVTIYTDDKEALLDAIKSSDDRLSATEFVNRPIDHDMIPRRQQQHQLEREPTHAREDITHVR